jgi:hypothetical protein
MGFESIAPLRTFGCVMRMSTTEESSLQRKETVILSKSNLITAFMSSGFFEHDPSIKILYKHVQTDILIEPSLVDSHTK